ncbi:MAG: DUF6514 family protein [Oscillospiraceae bacterium]|nr:DUF6514 family protein [Oscillospiraceae bacterium]
MDENQLVTQSYVLLDQTKEFTLEYYLYYQFDLNGTKKYGITVLEKCEDEVISESAIVSENEDMVIKLIHLFAKNFVFPCSVNEILSDLKLVNC